MNKLWSDQLIALGATGDALTSSVAYPVSESVQIIDRSDLVVLNISGSEAGSFLQAQTCNDHALVDEKTAQLSGYCTPKGRLLALPIVAAGPGDSQFYWLLPKDIAEAITKRLTMFVMRSDVTIKIEENWAVMSLAVSSDAVDESVEPWLFGSHEALTGSLADFIQTQSTQSRDVVWASAVSGILGDIEAGFPSVSASTQDTFIPQMVNLEQLDGLSFKKGCYPGQEIVARMHYLGKVKRTMQRFSSDAPDAAAAGDAVHSGDDDNAGNVVASVKTDNGTEYLAVVKTSVDPKTVEINGAGCTPVDLPYS